jgi:hypothetical protein
VLETRHETFDLGSSRQRRCLTRQGPGDVSPWPAGTHVPGRGCFNHRVWRETRRKTWGARHAQTLLLMRPTATNTAMPGPNFHPRPTCQSREAPARKDSPKGKETTVTVRRLTSKGTVLPAAATAVAGTPQRKLILPASVVLVLLASALGACSSSSSTATSLNSSTTTASAAPTAHGTSRPLTGTATGTATLNLTTGAATSHFTGHLSPLGPETGQDNLTFTLTGGSTFTYTGKRTFVATNGDKLFSAINGSGTFTSTASHSTETDTITGGTGRYAGASGTYKDTISSVVVSTTSTNQTSRVTAAAQGDVSY